MKFLLIMMCLLPLADTKPLTAQQVAQARVDYMAKKNYRWHPPFHIPNKRLWKVARFEGAGWGSVRADPKRMGTCTPRRKMRLVGDAWARSKHGTFRIRLWK